MLSQAQAKVTEGVAPTSESGVRRVIANGGVLLYAFHPPI